MTVFFSWFCALWLLAGKESLGFTGTKKLPGLCHLLWLCPFASSMAHLSISLWERRVCAVGNKEASQTWQLAVIWVPFACPSLPTSVCLGSGGESLGGRTTKLPSLGCLFGCDPFPGSASLPLPVTPVWRESVSPGSLFFVRLPVNQLIPLTCVARFDLFWQRDLVLSEGSRGGRSLPGLPSVLRFEVGKHWVWVIFLLCERTQDTLPTLLFFQLLLNQTGIH